MKIIKIELENWRSFYGKHYIDFSCDPEKPITLLFGANGAGKTSLLNAFTWTIYGEFTDGFDEHTKLINFRALTESISNVAKVSLYFEHEIHNYQITRCVNNDQQLSGEDELTIKKDGKTATASDIHKILPKALMNLFFFPAESFSNASILKKDIGSGESLQVGKAIKALLSGDVYEQAISDINDAIYDDSLKTPMNYKDKTIERSKSDYNLAEGELNSLRERKEELPEKISEAKKEYETAAESAKSFDKKLFQEWHKKQKLLQSKRETSLQNLIHIKELEQHFLLQVSAVFVSHSLQNAVLVLNKAEERGVIPPRIHESVISKSLEISKCVMCGNSLDKTNIERLELLGRHISDSTTSLKGIEIKNVLEIFKENLTKEAEAISEKLADMLEHFVDIQRIDAQDMKSLSSSIREIRRTAAQDFENKNNELNEFNLTEPLKDQTYNPMELLELKNAKYESLKSELTNISDKINAKKENVESLLRDYQKKSQKNKEYKVKARAIEILHEAKQFFITAIEGLEEFGRKDFEDAINVTYQDLVNKPYGISVNKDFSIVVKQTSNNNEIPMSQSEKVLLLISFLGAIARLAPHYQRITKQSEQFDKTGGVETGKDIGFPVVLDAPTSVLDTEYELDVINALPELLPQVIIPVSSKSLKSWETIRNRIGKLHLMTIESPNSTDRHISWNGRDHKYSRSNSQLDSAQTAIMEIQ